MTKANIEPLDLKDFLPYRLSVVTNRISRNLSSMYAVKFNLSVAEWRVMAVLGQTADLSADDVCARTEMDKVSVSRAVTKLLAKKHLKRKFRDEDRRRSILRLSASGLAVYRRIVPLTRQYENNLLQALSRQEQQQLDRLLDKLDQQALMMSEGGRT